MSRPPFINQELFRVEFGQRLKAERDRLWMSQTSLGRQCGVGKGTQINYEMGKRSPDAGYLRNALCLGVDVLYVLFGIRTEAEMLNQCIGAVRAEKAREVRA